MYLRAEDATVDGAPGPPLGLNLGMPPAKRPPSPGGPAAEEEGGADPPGTGGALAMPLLGAEDEEPPLAFPATVGADRSFVCASRSVKKASSE